MEKQQTALAQSIARKKDKLKELKSFNRSNSGWSDEYEINLQKMILLKSEITEDEKLLSVEEEQLSDIAGFWGESGQSRIEVDFKQWFSDTFKND